MKGTLKPMWFVDMTEECLDGRLTIVCLAFLHRKPWCTEECPSMKLHFCLQSGWSSKSQQVELLDCPSSGPATQDCEVAGGKEHEKEKVADITSRVCRVLKSNYNI